MKKNKLQQAKDDAFNYLSYRERSKYEIRRKLEAKGYAEEIIQRVTEKLEKLGYLDDRRFARKWVKDRIRLNPRGRFKLRYELQKKGIAENIIDKTLADLMPDRVELEIAEKLAAKWLKKSKNRNKNRLKLKKYLYNRGISEHIIDELFRGGYRALLDT